MIKWLLIGGCTLVLSTQALAGPDAFKAGKTIPEFGKIAAVDVDQPLYKHQKFKVVFDVSKQATPGEINRQFNSAARFINMHTEAGIKEKNIKLAIVVHGGAAKDVSGAKYYAAHASEGGTDKENANAALVKALIDHKVEFYVCGQTARYYDIEKEDLLPGVKMSLSAMTAHALLQQKGYTLNPF